MICDYPSMVPDWRIDTTDSNETSRNLVLLIFPLSLMCEKIMKVTVLEKCL